MTPEESFAAAVWAAFDDITYAQAAEMLMRAKASPRHSGDCTKQPWTCDLCWYEETLRMGAQAREAIAASGTHVVVPRSKVSSMDELAKVLDQVAANIIRQIGGEYDATISGADVQQSIAQALTEIAVHLRNLEPSS